MLGSASDAEDLLQDAWVRFDRARTEDLRSPQAFATTIVTRLCLDRLKSARHRREEYVGPWLPEPVLTTGQQTPDVLAEKSESVTLAFLLLLEVLSAEERAVFLLKEIFDYEHSEIAEMLEHHLRQFAPTFSPRKRSRQTIISRRSWISTRSSCLSARKIPLIQHRPPPQIAT